MERPASEAEPTPGTVLAAIDGRSATGAVLATAGALAATLDDRLLALHVHQGNALRALVLADHVAAPLAIVRGDPCAEIVRTARQPGTDLLVLGARNRVLASEPLGRTVTAVLAATASASLVVPPGCTAWPVPAGLRVLVLTDRRDPTAALGSPVLRAQRDRGAELVLVDLSAVGPPGDGPATPDSATRARIAGVATQERCGLISVPATPGRWAPSVADLVAATDLPVLVTARSPAAE